MRRTMMRGICLLLLAMGCDPGTAFSDEHPHSPSGGSLGSVYFPTTGSPEVQQHFQRGVAALHSFWYEEALQAFQAATAIDPAFMMGYWGEAMTHNHPIWREQDADAGRAALKKLRKRGRETEREQAYLAAVEVLYGDGPKAARDDLYAQAMEQISRKYPDDAEAACFYALALLGTLHSQPGDGFRRRVEAGAIALQVFQKNPDHPCAAHYAIHAFDHPDLAILALPAAQQYARIAPESYHAQHMPAHIFLQLGRWAEAAAANERGWRDSVAWVSQKGLPARERDYHSLHWLLYVDLQLGRHKAAAEWLSRKQADMRDAAASSREQSGRPGWEVGRFYPDMAAEWVVETAQWAKAEDLWDVPGALPDDASRATAFFVRSIAASAMGKAAEAEQLLNSLRAIPKASSDARSRRSPKVLEIWELEAAALLAQARNASGQALESAKRAALLEETLPGPSGPPSLVKPAHELYGELLLQAGHFQEAADQFALSLQRHPNRACSLLGLARASARAGERAKASRYYAALGGVWAQADEELVEVREVREFIRTVADAGGH